MNSGVFARAIARSIVPRRSYGGGHHHHRAPTMNDLPVPQGDFFMHHAGVQRTHNLILAVGVIMFGTTLFIVKESKVINLNYSPPDTYE